MSDDWLQGLRPRIVSAAVMAAVALVALYAGPAAFDLLVAASAAVLAWEWTRLCGGGRFGWTGVIQAIAVVAVVSAAAAFSPGIAVALIVGGCAGDYVAARISGRRHPRWIAAGTAYIGLPCVALVWLRGDGLVGRELVLWLLVSVWATDIGAFFAGRLIGGPRLAPTVSPNKTWAGLAGGIAAAAVSGLALAAFGVARSAGVLALGGAVLAVVAQAGDLAESMVKRRFGAKDASRLIPGHGGLFDRVDGLLAAGLGLALWQWATDGAFLVGR